jgi:hypothetical protein
MLGHRLAFHTPQGTKLLRIHRKSNGDIIFTLSGRIDKDSIAELEALIAVEEKDRRIILEQCETAGIALLNCDPYVREWITGQKGGS